MRSIKIFAVSVVLILGIAGLSQAKTYQFTFATNAPENTLRGVAEKQFIEEVEKLSNGSIKITSYWAETLVTGKEILKSVQDGVVDFGFVNVNYFPKRLLLNGATGLLGARTY